MYKITFVLCAMILAFPIFAQQSSNRLNAAESVELWLNVLDQGDYQTSWELTAPLFRNQVSLDQWMRMAKNARTPLGNFRSRELLSAVYRSGLPDAPEADYIIFQYRTSFAKKDEAVETVTPMLVDGVWKVSGYYVR